MLCCILPVDDVGMPMLTSYHTESLLHMRYCKPALQLVSITSIFPAGRDIANDVLQLVKGVSQILTGVSVRIRRPLLTSCSTWLAMPHICEDQRAATAD